MPIELRLPGEGDDAFRKRAKRAARYARVLIDSALSNRAIRALIDDPAFPLWTEEGEKRNPTVRIDFEQAICIAGIGEELAATKNKHWGDGPYIQPLQADDPVDPMFVTYVFKENSVYNRRYEQRQKLKALLGKTHRPLVTSARRSTKQAFINASTSKQAYVIRTAIGVSLSAFWRLCHGEFMALPDKPVKIDAAILETVPEKPHQLQLSFTWSPSREDVQGP